MSGFAKAEWGVPHVDFKRTDDGFIVSFKRPPASVQKYAKERFEAQNYNRTLGPAIVGAVSLGLGHIMKKATTIIVTNDAVIIDNKKMSRDDFGGFCVYATWQLNSDIISVLGYSFGRQRFQFGGGWPEHKAIEIASALNALMS